MFFRKVITFALFLFIFIFFSCATLLKEDDNEQDKSRDPAKVPDDGYVRLVLNNKTGSFSLYYLADPKTVSYEPLFNDEEPLSSFLSINIDGKVYRLGNTRQFQTKIDRLNGDPAFVFESPFVRVTQLFTPIKTSGSSVANGIMITIKVQNITSVKSAIGVRMLLDTNLGEGRRRVPFLTNTQVVTSETVIDGNSNELFWISRGSKISLMGSIVNPVDGLGKGPEIVHLANWKRLNDANWKLPFLKGRSFNNLPYSVNDSAVCYYFGPEILDNDKILTYTVFLTTEDLAWYKLSSVPAHITDSTAAAAASKPPAASGSKTEVTIVTNPSTAASNPSGTASNQSGIASNQSGTASNTVTSVTLKPNESAAQTTEQVVIIIPPEYIYTVDSTINITAIESQAQNEAAANNESADTLTLIKLQEILNLFINGQIFLSEQDLTEIEQAIEKHRIRN